MYSQSLQKQVAPAFSCRLQRKTWQYCHPAGSCFVLFEKVSQNTEQYTSLHGLHERAEAFEVLLSLVDL